MTAIPAGTFSGSLWPAPARRHWGIGSVRLALPGTVDAREAYGTAAYAGTRLDKITKLDYSTYRSAVDAGSNLAIALQFDMDYNLTDAYMAGRVGWFSNPTWPPAARRGKTPGSNGVPSVGSGGPPGHQAHHFVPKALHAPGVKF